MKLGTKLDDDAEKVPKVRIFRFVDFYVFITVPLFDHSTFFDV
jgi:hypothetical protein